MSKYTIRLDEICNYLYNHQPSEIENLPLQNVWGGGFDPNLDNPFDDNISQTEIITSVLPKIFDFDFPMFDSSHKVELETKIIKHYYMHEIGFETFGRWKFALEERLNLIMPFYNDLYKSVTLQGDDPLINTDIHETRQIEGSGTNNSTMNTKTDNNNREVVQNTPTSKIGNTDYASGIIDNIQDGTTNNTSNGSNTNNENMDRHITGLSAYSKQDMIQRYRQNIINVDEAIVNELFDLFMLIY